MSTTESTATRSLLAVVLVGAVAGVLAGVAMLVTLGVLRLVFGWPTPTELIFDRLFPFLTVEFFINSLVKAGGYTPLKLQGVYGALAGQVVVAAIGGVIYSWYLNRLDRRQRSANVRHGIVDARGWRLIVPGVLMATGLFVILLWPTLITNYHGLPPARARIVASLEMLISFSVCGFSIMLFHALLSAGPAKTSSEGVGVLTVGRRRFLALGIGAALAVALSGLLRRLYRIGTFSYDGRQYGGPGVQKVTPIRPRDEFYQVSKNLIDPMIVRDSWQLDIIGQVENPQVYSFADIAAMPAVEQETTLL